MYTVLLTISVGKNIKSCLKQNSHQILMGIACSNHCIVRESQIHTSVTVIYHIKLLQIKHTQKNGSFPFHAESITSSFKTDQSSISYYFIFIHFHSFVKEYSPLSYKIHSLSKIKCSVISAQ